MQGHGDLANMSYAFPHTYLGGMPYVCAGASGGDPCATGTPVWPIWMPAMRAADNASFLLRQLEVPRPGRSTRAALIYLGWGDAHDAGRVGATPRCKLDGQGTRRPKTISATGRASIS
jgi:hypothetical protein